MECKKIRGKRCVLWTLFTSMLSISTFTFGGGFVIVTLMKRRYVEELGWMNEQEMLDIVALAQSAPGAIAVNAAILVGQNVCGGLGMLVSVLGTIIPPMAILSIISLFYRSFAQNYWIGALFEGMQAGVAAVVSDVAWKLGSGVIREKDCLSLGIMLAAFLATCVCKVSAVYVILAAAGVGLCRWMIQKGRGWE